MTALRFEMANRLARQRLASELTQHSIRPSVSNYVAKQVSADGYVLAVIIAARNNNLIEPWKWLRTVDVLYRFHFLFHLNRLKKPKLAITLEHSHCCP